MSLSKTERERLVESLGAAILALNQKQRVDGHWCAELQGDSILASEYVLMKFILAQENQPFHDGSDRETLTRIVRWLRRMQREDGTWGQYPGSAMDLSATVKGYFVLKLMGDNPNEPHMQKARKAIRDAGGAERCNSYTKIFLACLGQISWNAVPAIPPEIIFLPRWCFFHLDKVSAWTRTMILPLAIVSTLRPTRPLPFLLGIDELYVDEKERHRLTLTPKSGQRERHPAGMEHVFIWLDRLLKFLHSLGGSPIRRLAIKHAFEWIEKRAGQDGEGSTDGVGAIFPPMVYWQIVLHALGYPRHDPLVRRAEKELDEFFIDAGDHIRIQPCFSPVWDTGIALYALTDCGLGIEHEPVRRAAAWLRDKQSTFRGDWVRNVPHLPDDAGWWYFEYNNAWYPDVDDTAMVSMALRRSGGASNQEAGQRGVNWIFAMQNRDGGWAAFDRTEDRPILEKVPFADHNAMQDPSCPDITGRVLECLSWHGVDKTHPSVQEAIEYIRSKQEADGCWFGRWGVNYIYGTWQAVIGPIRCGEDPSMPWIQRAGAWMKSIQKEDGSFGETADSYIDPSLKGTGPSTASQTAWAAMVLQEIFGPDDPDLKRAIAWLMDRQLTHEQAADSAINPDEDPAGAWAELEYTGTGFPEVFYLRYHLYRLYFPIMAIGRFASAHNIKLAPQRFETSSTTSPSEQAEPVSV